MAGRGTDIKLGDGVDELGGLHVICTEMHDAARIDRQLIGRCGRQGDPGTLPRISGAGRRSAAWGLGPDKVQVLKELGETHRRPAVRPTAPALFRKAQRKIEAPHFRDRRVLMYLEKERKKMQRQMGQDPYLDTPG